MTKRTHSATMKNGIERIEKIPGATALEQMMRYNSGALRYELECAFAVLKRVVKAMPDANDEELRKLVAATLAANAVLTGYFVHGDAISKWLPTAADGVMNTLLEAKLQEAMNNIDHAVAKLKPYLVGEL